MKCATVGLVVLVLLVSGTGQALAGFVYDFQNYSSLQAGFTLSGSITTDINNGTLSAADITAWTITITSAGGSATTYDSTMIGSYIDSTGALNVSPTEITLASGVLDFTDAAHYSPLQYNRSSATNQLYISKPDGFTTNWFDFLGTTNLGGDPWVIATEASNPAAVPEPSTLTLLGIGAVCSLGYGWRRRRQSA